MSVSYTHLSYTEFLQSPTYNEYFKKAFQNTSIIDFTNQNKIICSTDKNFSFNDISAKIVQKIGEKNIFAVDFITIEDQLDVTQEDESTEEEIATKNTVYQRNFGTSFTWKSNWNAKNSLLFNVSNSQYELDSKTTNLEDIYGYKKQENYVYDNSIKIDNSYKINDKYRLNAGYQLNLLRVQNKLEDKNISSFEKTNERILEHALFAEAKMKDLSLIHI